jgi:uncharacterized protein YndB with AHSA1/START domain/DNA-binding transcriptional ArsR family regulator
LDEAQVFRALADRSRRHLLDSLRDRDGRSIRSLGADLRLSRFGVAKHLRALEAAGLVTSRKVGRERLHYLNPIPIQQIYERWVSRYAVGWTRTMTDLKAELESPPARPAHVYRVFIRATPERVWQALTDGSLTERYFYAGRMTSEWDAGSPYALVAPDGTAMIAGEVLESEPPHRLVLTFRFVSRKDAPSRLTWEIEPRGQASMVTLTHEFDRRDGSFESVDDPMGWQFILSNLKTVLETGESLEVSA